MKPIKKWLIVTIVVTFAFSVFQARLPAKEWPIAVKLSAGLDYLAVGDSNYFLASRGSSFGPDSSFDTFHGGMDAAAELIYFLNPRLGIGLGVGFTRGKLADNAVVLNTVSSIRSYSYDTEIECIPVRLGVHYLFSNRKKLSLYLHGGIAYYFARWSQVYNLRFDYTGINYQYWYKSNSEAKARGVGFHAGIGLAIKIFKPFTLVIEALGRYAPIDGFSGEKRYANNQYDYSDTPIKGSLYYFEYYDEYQRDWVKSLDITGRPAGIGTRNVKKAVVDFSGAAIRAGLIIRF